MNCRQEVVDAIPCRRPHADDFSSQFSVLSSQQTKCEKRADNWELIFKLVPFLLRTEQLTTEN